MTFLDRSNDVRRRAIVLATEPGLEGSYGWLVERVAYLESLMEIDKQARADGDKAAAEVRRQRWTA